MSRLFRRRPLAGLAALVGLGLLAAGCSGGGSGSAGPGGLEKTNLNVAAVPAMDSAGLYIAQERGLFAAEGLHVSILPATSGATAIGGQLASQFDVTVGNYVSYIHANSQAKNPADFRVLTPGSIMQPGNQEIMVPSTSNITKVSQLAGKSIAVNVQNNIGTLLVKSVLADNAVDPTSVHFVPVKFPDMATALSSGRVDAAWMPEPFVSKDEESIGAVPLADSNQGTTQNIPISGYMVTADLAEEVPEHRGGLPHGDHQGPGHRGHRPRRHRAGHGEVRGHLEGNGGDRERAGVPDPAELGPAAAAGRPDAELRDAAAALQREPDDREVVTFSGHLG